MCWRKKQPPQRNVASYAKNGQARRPRRQEGMTEPGEKGLGVPLAESVQQGNRLVSRELLPLLVPFPENEHVESEHLRSLSRAVRSRVVRRLGCQGWANDGVRSMNEIYSKTSASEAGSWRVCSNSHLYLEFAVPIKGQRLLSASPPRKPSSALRFCAWIHRQWCQIGHLQGGSRFLARPMFEDGRWC